MIGLSGSNMVPGLYMMAAAALSIGCLLAIRTVRPITQPAPSPAFAIPSEERPA